MREHRQELDALRKRLKEYLNSKEANELIDGAKDADIFKLAEKYRDGVRLASPVFDGAAEDEIFNLLAEKPISRSAGQVTSIRWPQRRALRRQSHSRSHVHHETASPG